MRRSLVPTFLFLSVSIYGQDSLGVHLLHHWEDTTLPASAFHNNTYNEVWGYAADGKEYAIIGSTMGTHVFDVTHVALGQVDSVGFIPGAAQGAGVVHRDYKTLGNYLYAVCDEGMSTLQIIDLQFLPDSVSLVYWSDTLFSRAHNIFIDTLNARLYTCGGTSQFSVYDISDPIAPTLLADLEADVPWWGQSVGYVHDAYVRNNIAYTNDENALHVIDMTVPSAPVLLGSLTSYAEQGYNHSGWLHPSEDLYAMCDETHGTRVKLVDVSDLSDINVIDLFGTAIDPLSIVHNVLWNGDLLHASYYHDGYQLWQLGPTNTMQRIGYYDTSTEPHANNYRGAWGVYPSLPSGIVLVSDMQTGLWVFDISQAVGVAGRIAQSAPTFRAAPNPTTGTMRFEFMRELRGAAHVRWTDLCGRMVLEQVIATGDRTVDIGMLPDGMYIATVIDENGMASTRVIKN